MVDQVITKQELINAKVDAKTLEDTVNGPPDIKVTSRLGRQYWTLATIDSKVASVVSQANYALVLIQDAQDQIVEIADTAQAQFDVKMADLEGQANSTINEWQAAINTIVVNDGVPALSVSTATGQDQQEINDFGGAKWRSKAGGYKLGATVVLDNGDIVKSTVANNTINPNVDMTGWINPSAEQDKINTIVYKYLNLADNWGAKGDGVTVDTTAVQNAINNLNAAWISTGKMQTLLFRGDAKGYVMNGVSWKPGVKFATHGEGKARFLKTPANPGDTEEFLKFRRIIQTNANFAIEAPNLLHTIDDIIFDGNINNMNWTWESYNQEQGQSLILTCSSGSNENDRAKFELNNVEFYDSVSDGICIHTNIDVVLNNCIGQQNWRGGVTIVGGNSRVIANNWVGEKANIHIEVDGGSSFGYKTNVTINGGEVDRINKDNALWGGTTAHTRDGATVTYNNFKCHSGSVYIFACSEHIDGKIIFNDCELSWLSGVIYAPPKLLQFNNTYFKCDARAATAITHGIVGSWTIVSRPEVIAPEIIFNGGRAIGLYADDAFRGSFIRMNLGGTTADPVASPYKMVRFIGGFGVEGFLQPYSTIAGGQVTQYDDVYINTPTFLDIALATAQVMGGAYVEIGRVHIGEKNSLFMRTQNNHAVSKIIYKGTTIPLVKYNSTSGAVAAFFDFEGQLTLTTPNKTGLTLSAVLAPPNARILIGNAGKGLPSEYTAYAENFSGDKCRVSNKWSLSANNTASFDTASMPVLAATDIGAVNYNTTLAKFVTWNGTAWI